MKEKKGGGGEPSVDERYSQWKLMVPVLYDWLANHNLVWSSLSCRWGPQLEQATYKNRQRLNLSEQVEKAHNADLHCVDWNPLDVNLILTGSADNSVRMFDCRKLTSGGVGSPIHIFEGHTATVLCVQWSPDRSSVFGSSAEDSVLNVWDHKMIWRMIDLIYRPEEEGQAELEKFKSRLHVPHPELENQVAEKHPLDEVLDFLALRIFSLKIDRDVCFVNRWYCYNTWDLFCFVRDHHGIGRKTD